MKKSNIKCPLTIVISTLACFCTSAVTAAIEPSAKSIMSEVISRDDGTTKIQHQEITTCKYGIKNNKISCSETPRVKVAESYGKDYGKNEEDSRSLTIIVSPASERGIGLLQYDYGDVTKVSDQWIYLSALGKPKRVASGKLDEDEPKKGSLFGSEFALEDLEKIRLSDYTYEIVKEVEYKGRDTWVIKMTPTDSRAKKSNYSKMLVWVDKERHVSLKTQYYDRSGVYLKRKTESEWEKQDGVWYPRQMSMNNLLTKRISVMKTASIALNVPIDDEFLTLRSLTDNAFRERNMESLKSAFN